MPHHIITGEPFDAGAMSWALRDFTPEELEAAGHADGVEASEASWRGQHVADRTGIEIQNRLRCVAWEHSDRSEPPPEPMSAPPIDLPTPPLIRPAGHAP